MKSARPLLCLLLVAVLLSGCIGSGPKATSGGLAGAAGGGLLGAAMGGGWTGVAAGVILGSLAGSAIGDALDQRDRELAAKEAQRSLETRRSGDTSEWKNPDSGHSGTFTPTRTYQNAEGVYCRDFRQTVSIEGESEEVHGTACRQPDGTWKLAS